MPSIDDLNSALLKADAAGDTQSAQLFANQIKVMRAAVPNPVGNMPAIDPSAGGSTLNIAGFDTGIKTPEVVDRTLSGMGQAVANTGRGVGQMLGLVSRDDVAQARKLDAPLDATTAGKVGNFVGNLGMMAPLAVMAPAAGGGFLAQTGINALSGAGLGLIQPSTSTKETAENIGIGALGGGVTPAIGRGAQAIGNYASSFVAPLFKSGQEAIAGRALNTFAGSPQAAQDAVSAMKAATPAVPGVQPTVGMVSGNAGLANYGRAVANMPQNTTAFGLRDQSNTNAILDALKNIAGSPGQRDFFAADRDAAANALYGKARASYDPSAVTPEMQAQIDSLLKRPSITAGSKDAQRIAMEDGRLPSADGSFASMEDIGHSLDDQINSLKTSGQTKLAGKVAATKNQLLDLMDNLSPDYKAARATYAEMSQPINRMDTGQALLDKLSPALNEFRTQKVLRPSAFADALDAGDAFAQKATGFSGAKMDQVLTPQDMQTVQGVGKTLGQISDAQSMGKAIGSNTVQNQVSADALRGIAGPLGLPQGFTENALMKRLMFPQQLMGKYAEPNIQEILAEAALDPQRASGLMLQQLQKTDDPRLQNALARALLLGSRTEAATLSQ